MLGIVSGLFLVFAGLLIGYFLSSREQGEETTSRLHIAKENASLKESLSRGQQTLAELEAKYSRQNGQINVLQQLCDDWASSREEADRDRAKLEVLVTEYQTKSESLAEQLKEQAALRIELEDQLHQIQHQQVEQLGVVETNWLKKYSEVESERDVHQVELDHLRSEQSRTAEQLHEAEAKVAELTSQLDSQKTMYETASNNATGLKQEYVSLETSLEHISLRLKDSEAKCAKANSAKRLAEDSLEAIRSQLDEQRNENVELKASLANLELVKQQFSDLQTALNNSDDRIKVVASERDKAIGAEKSAHEHTHGLQKRIENQESTIQLLRKNHDNALENLRAEVEKRSELERSFDGVRQQFREELASQTEQLSAFSAERDAFSNRFNELDQMRSELSSSIEKANQELTHYKSRCSELEKSIAAETDQKVQFESSWKQSCSEAAEFKAECERLQNLVTGETRDREALLAENNSLQSRVEAETSQRSQLESRKVELESSLKTLKARSDQMMVELSELQSIRDQHSLANDKWKQYRVRLEQTLSQRDQSMTKLNTREERIKLLELQLESANGTIRMLRDQLTEAKSKQDSDSMILSLSQARVTVDLEYGGETRMDSARGTIFTARPKIVDDLKLISGVAEVLEGKLNDFGVYTFRQIMEWNEAHIAEFQQLLPSFKDRIVRDDWVGQAAHLYEHFHSEEDGERRVA